MSPADTSAKENDDLISVRIVLGALARAWDESDFLAGHTSMNSGGEAAQCGVEDSQSWICSITSTKHSASASSYSRIGEGGHERRSSGQDSSSADPFKSNGCASRTRQNFRVEQDKWWTFRESVIMAYEGVLKQLAGNGNTFFASPYFSGRGRHTPAVDRTPDSTTEKREMHTAVNWSDEAVVAAPTICEVVRTMVRHTESALFEAEVKDLMLANAECCFRCCGSS